MAPESDFMKRLEDELSSCQMPTVDPDNASVEEIVKDMHRVLTGNGGPTRGLVVKVAAANVSIKEMHEHVDAVAEDLAKQKKVCHEFRTKHALAAAAAEGAKAKKFVQMLWENRALIAILLFAAVMYLTTGWREQADQNQINAQVNEALTQKLEKLLDLPRGSLAARNKNAESNNSRTNPR
jgi:hypothetical protein